MKTPDDIQAAHDRLVAIILGEVPWPFAPNINGENMKLVLQAQADVLCWALEHGHNKSFQENLDNLDAVLAEKGYVFEKEAIH